MTDPRDLDEELRFHHQKRVEEFMNRGMSRDESERLARARFGDAAGLKDFCRQLDTRLSRQERRRRRPSVMHAIGQDIRYAVRSFRKRPGFTAAALLTLALGIGANTAIFSVVYAVLLRDLPYPEPDRIVQLYETNRRYNFDNGVINPFNFDVWEREARSFEALAAIRSGRATLTGSGDAERLAVRDVMPSFFDVMGIGVQAGRVFTAQEAEADARVVVLSHEIWVSRFASDPAILDRSIQLDDQAWTVVGVLPPEFRYNNPTDIWRPLYLTPAVRAQMGSYYLGAVARLRPGVSIDAAQQELSAIAARLETEYPAQRKDRGARVAGFHADMVSRVADGLKLLQLVVAIVLLIACANLANLLLAQACARQRELAVRSAVGAFRWRLVRQLLTESVVLASVGGVLGALVAALGVPALVAAAPERLQPSFTDVGISLPVLLFTMAAATVCGILFGVGPALLFSRPNVVETLRQEGHGSAGAGRGRQRWLRSGLITAEVALAFVLLFGSALLVRSFAGLMSQQTGFESARLLTANVTLPPRYEDDASRRAFWQQLFDRLDAAPEVAGATGSTALPFSLWEWQTDFEVEGRPDLKHDGSGIRTVTANYFSTMEIPAIQGRSFIGTDSVNAEPVVVVNEAFARRFLSGLNPVGQRVKMGRTDTRWRTIVGVFGNARRQLDTESGPEIYQPLSQDAPATLILALRTRSAPESAIGPLRTAVREVDTDVPLQAIKSMEDLIGDTVALRRFHMTLLTMFAAVASILTLVGIYGVTTYVVGLRTREMGIRVALGAAPRSVGTLIVRQGVTPVFIGLAMGLGLCVLAGRALESQLFAVTRLDPASLALTGVMFLGISLLACLVPARRSARVDPMVALRD